MGQWLPDSMQARYEDARDQFTSNPASFLPGATLIDSDNMVGVVDGEPVDARAARMLDYQNQLTSNPLTLLPGATLIDGDHRVGYVDGENVGNTTDVDREIAERFGVEEQLEQIRDIEVNPDDFNPDNWAPGWLRALLGRPKVLLTVVAGGVALHLLGPLLGIVENATEG